MGKKFTSDDLFRIATDNLSAVQRVEFRFLCATGEFREIVGSVFERDLNLDKDERNLLERIFSKLARKGILRGGRG